MASDVIDIELIPVPPPPPASCHVPNTDEEDLASTVTFSDGSQVIGSQEFESAVDAEDVAAIQTMLPNFSCDVRAFFDIPFAQVR